MLKGPNKSVLHQLPFPFHHNEKCTFENFYTGPNAVTLTALKRLIKQRGSTETLYLWGHPFVGCSHLLKAACRVAQQEGLQAVYFSYALEENVLDIDRFSRYELLCLDDVEAIAYNKVAEENLFKLYNELVTKRIPIIFGAHQVPHQLAMQLPDLVSRLNSGLIFQVRELNDEQKIAALRLRAQLRGFELSEVVARFLLSRLPRSSRVLLDALNQLDVFALAQKRKLSMPFVKEVLGL